MRIIRYLAVLALAAVLGAILVQAAFGGPILNKVGQSLRSNPVYVDPAAHPSITADQAASLRKKIDAGPHPLFIALLPDAVGGEVNHSLPELMKQLGQAVGLSGVYAFVVDGHFRAGATSSADVPQAESLGTSSFQKYSSQGLYPVLDHFVSSVESQPGGATPKKGGGFPWWIIVLGVLALAAVTYLWRRSRHSKQDFGSSRNALHSKINVLQDAINNLTVNGPRAETQYGMAVSSISEAMAAIGRAKNVSDLKAASDLYKEANEHYQAAQAADTTQTTTHDEEDQMHLPGRKHDEEPQATQPAAQPTGQRPATKPENVAATNAPRHAVPQGHRPQPQTVVNVNNYPANVPSGASGLGYYPRYGGWGYWDPFGMFMPYAFDPFFYGGDMFMDMLIMDEMFDGGFGFGGNDTTVIDNNTTVIDDQPDAQDQPVDPGDGGGDFTDDPDTSGLGGGDFGGSGDDTSWTDSSTDDSYGGGDTTDWSGGDDSSWGGDSGGGGDFGGGFDDGGGF